MNTVIEIEKENHIKETYSENIKITYRHRDTNKINNFFKFIKNNGITVKKIEIPSRDARHDR